METDIPEVLKEDLGNALNNLRGVVMTCYAQIEFGLTDISLRCSYLECYSEIVPKFPRKIEDKIKAIRRYAGATGPLSPYQQEIESAIEHINRFTELRDLMGHAKAHIDIAPNAHAVYFEMYRITKGGNIQLIRKKGTISELSNDVERLILYTHTMMRIFSRMYEDLPSRYSASGPIPEI